MAAVTATLEVRWFQAGPPPEPISGWFLNAPVPANTESRTDVYLDVPDRDDVGVKVRAGDLLELKLRTAVHTGLALAEGFEGRVESWKKWGLPLHPAKIVPGGGSLDWINVAKTRRSRFYEITSDEGSFHAVASTELPTELGCAAELVEVRVGAEVAWGVGFEAFGTSPDLRGILVAGMKACVADTPLGSLDFAIRDSYSYPSFLSQWPPR